MIWLVVWTYPSEKSWSWDDDIPNWMESHKSHVPHQQPGMLIDMVLLYNDNGWLCRIDKDQTSSAHGEPKADVHNIA